MFSEREKRTVVIVVLIVAISKSNLDGIPKHVLLMKEKSIAPCRADSLTRVHMQKFHFS